MTTALDRLLTTLDVRVHAFAVCEVAPGRRLVFEPMDAVIVHHVLAGTGVLRTSTGAAVRFAPYSVLVVPPRQPQSLGEPFGGEGDVLATDGCSAAASACSTTCASRSPRTPRRTSRCAARSRPLRRNWRRPASARGPWRTRR